MGVLFPAAQEGETGADLEDPENLDSTLPPSVVPRVHVISVQKLAQAPLKNLTVQENSVLSLQQTRNLLVDYLSSYLHNDRLAAEYLLLNLLSKV